MAVQVKVTREINSAFRRKMKHLLRTEKENLHEVVLVGVSLETADPFLVHLVHKDRCYDTANVGGPHFMVEKTAFLDRLLDLYHTEKAGTCVPTPARSYTFSPATLVEVEAREDFESLLAESGLNYETSRVENDAAGGYLWATNRPERKWRVQEKVLTWRYARSGKPVGLRVSLRRNRGCAILSMYPEAPGVETARDGWAEKYFARRDEVATFFTNLLNQYG
eukprot:g9332.t1